MNADSSLIRLSEGVYRSLLVAYPVRFRQAYGRHMVQVFRDVCRDAYRERGNWGLLVWWAVALFDLLRSTIAEHRKAGFTVSNFKLSQWAGWLCLFGGVFFAAASISQLQPGSHYDFSGVYQLSIYALVPGMALVALGLIGIFMRYNATLNLFGKATLGAAILGAGIASLSWLLTLTGSDSYSIFLAGWMLHLAGVSPFGGFAVTTRLLPHWNWALLVGSAMPLTVVVLSFANRQQEIDGANWGSVIMLLLIAIGWILTGVALNGKPASSVQPVPAA